MSNVSPSVPKLIAMHMALNQPGMSSPVVSNPTGTPTPIAIRQIPDGSEGGNCVEVATCPTTVHIRDSKVTQGPHLDVAPATWSAFVAYAQLG
ncbi:DUF397 domain-containing protein [Streptomyces sp. NPDC002540]